MFINYKNKLKNKLMNNTYNIIYIVWYKNNSNNAIIAK
jgi:hypothetical protein